MAGLDDFLGGVTVAERPSGSPAEADGESGPRAANPTSTRVPGDPQQEGLSTTEEPRGVVQLELPSGLEIYYQEAPKRLYRVRQGLLSGAQGDPIDWVEVPSISTITKILDKPGLVSWAEKIGVNLVQELLRNEWVDLDFVTQFNAGENPDPRKPWWGGAHLLEIGATKKLTNYYIKDAGAVKGQGVHDALEAWAMSGTLMDPDKFPETERGYVAGLNKFLTESRLQPLRSEVMVGSATHLCAGRFDLYGELPEAVELYTHITAKGRGDKKEWFEPGTELVDLKTTAGIYADHHLQVTGYQGLCVDSGYERPDHAGVLRVTLDGRYQYKRSRAEWEDFWFLRGLYDSLRRIEGKGD